MGVEGGALIDGAVDELSEITECVSLRASSNGGMLEAVG